MQRISIREDSHQPVPDKQIPGCTVRLKFSQHTATIARYEAMSLVRPIEIRSGLVTVFARPGTPPIESVLTLDPPRPGKISDEGDDERMLEICSLTAAKVTVTTPPHAIGGEYQTATFAGIGSNLRLIGMAGRWYVSGSHGVKLK